MEIKPVKKAKTPEYPKKEEVSAKTLSIQVPSRWNASATVKLSLGALAAISLAGCNEPLDGVPIPPPTPAPIIEDVLMGDPAPPTVWVAPLFLHGEGRAEYNGAIVEPPVFLSETEALEVINKVALEYGLKFSQDGPALSNVQQPVPNLFVDPPQEKQKILMTFVPDFVDENGILIEFVSADDVKRWEQEQKALLPESSVAEVSASSYDLQDAAEQLVRALEYSDAPYGQYVAGVLYDPCETLGELESDTDKKSYIEQSRAMSLEQLEKQVREFFEWLKRQEII